MNELIVLALHRRMEALVADLVDRSSGPALLIAAHVRSCSLVAWSACFHAPLVLSNIVL